MKFLRLIALVLTAAVLLSGCGMVDFGEYFGAVRSLVDGNAIVPYESMTYERPDMTQLRQTLDAACEAAEGDDVSAILDGIYDFYDAYDWFSTYYALADIHYCADLTDTYWEVEYNYCTQNAATVDAALQELYRALAQSPAREKLEQEEYFGEGFFDSYEDEESVWDETFTAMLEEEARLQTRYYELSAQAADYQDDTQGYYDACADGMASLLAELIAVRQEIAEYCGYSDYPQFAEDFYFYRDYTAAEEEKLLDDIRRELVPLEQKDMSLLVVGLGNREVTPDALGPNVVDQLFVTRHMIREFGTYALGEEHTNQISGIVPGVMAQTGMESLEIVQGVAKETKPDCIFVIDALAARSVKRLNRTIQITDAGINPGSGVGNHRNGINRESIGVPVIAIGVPTVVDAATIVSDTMSSLIGAMTQAEHLKRIGHSLNALEESEKHALFRELLSPSLNAMFVTPKDIDESIRQISLTLSEGLNLAFQKHGGMS